MARYVIPGMSDLQVPGREEIKKGVQKLHTWLRMIDKEIVSCKVTDDEAIVNEVFVVDYFGIIKGIDCLTDLKKHYGIRVKPAYEHPLKTRNIYVKSLTS